MKIHGVLFDMDGLMFDTESVGYRGWKYAGEQLGVLLSDGLIASFRGTGSEEKRMLFAAETGRPELYETAHAMRKTYAEKWIAENGLAIKPGLKELLEYIAREKIPAALATATAREKAEEYLDMAGVKQYFAASVCGMEAGRAKPAPDIFQKAAAALSIPAGECLVLEDSPNGLKAGRAAGCMTAVIPDLTPAPPEEEDLWDWKLASLEEVIGILEEDRRK